MKKSGPDRQYTEDFRQSAVKQVIDGGRSIPQVARSLEIPKGTLGNWVWRIRKGEPLMKRPPLKPVTELEAEVTRTSLARTYAPRAEWGIHGRFVPRLA